MVTSFKKTKPKLDPITNEIVQPSSVEHFKLLGVWVSNSMQWKYYMEHIIWSRFSQTTSAKTTETWRCCRRFYSYDLQVCWQAIVSVNEYGYIAWHNATLV